jgi:hypothetical protein
MDTIFPDSALRSRAVDSETMWRSAYALIIATEASTGFLLALGAVVLLVRLRASAKIFNNAKLWAVAGLTLFRFCGDRRRIFCHVANRSFGTQRRPPSASPERCSPHWFLSACLTANSPDGFGRTPVDLPFC